MVLWLRYDKISLEISFVYVIMVLSFHKGYLAPLVSYYTLIVVEFLRLKNLGQKSLLSLTIIKVVWTMEHSSWIIGMYELDIGFKWM